ncbi:MAG: lysophospholipid acyltransferase family protein [Planctomycetes bacterium]|nr:lysophospholipid acyltransferase family protein [Planctomycetota bacterium]
MSDDRATPRTRWWHPVVGALVRFALWTFAILPEWIAYRLADLAAVPLIAYTLLHERRVSRLGRGMFRNQRIVFRDAWTPRLGRRLLMRWARHMTALGVEFARMPRLRREDLERFVNVDEIYRMLLVERPDGALCLTGHMGCWEYSGYVASLMGFPVSSIARPIGVPELDEIMRRRRSGSGQEIIPKVGALRPMRRVLQRGDVVGLVADEIRPQNPIFVPFLGTVAPMNPTVAKLHLSTRAPIVVATVQRQHGRPRHRYHVWDVIRWQPYDDEETAIFEVSRRINDAYSRAVLSYPEQWLWGSRRFHVRPAGESLGPDGLPPAVEPVDLSRLPDEWARLLG